jgi:hypothetical protein
MIKIGPIVFGGAIVLGAAAAGFWLYKRSIGRKAEKIVAEKSQEEFAASASAFSGLYEPLYMMANGISRYRVGVVGDWAARTANLKNAEHYRRMWDERFPDSSEWDEDEGPAKLNELLSFVFSTGVCRDDAVEIIVDGHTYKKYATIDGEMIEAGSSAAVKAGYWFKDDLIIEKGIIQKKTEGV